MLGFRSGGREWEYSRWVVVVVVLEYGGKTGAWFSCDASTDGREEGGGGTIPRQYPSLLLSNSLT